MKSQNKIIKKLMICLTVFLMGKVSKACDNDIGWNKPVDDLTSTNVSNQNTENPLEQKIHDLEQNYDISIKLDDSSRCLNNFNSYLVYHSVDKSSEILLASIPIPQNLTNFQQALYLSTRVHQLNKTDRDQLIQLSQARKIFYNDNTALKEETGLNFLLFDNKESQPSNNTYKMLYPVVCKEDGSSRTNVSAEHYITLPLVKYTPFIQDYTNKIYSKNDLQNQLTQSFKSKKIVEAVTQQYENNLKFCREFYRHDHKTYLENLKLYIN